jgi:hypothetical protein
VPYGFAAEFGTERREKSTKKGKADPAREAENQSLLYSFIVDLIGTAFA